MKLLALCLYFNIRFSFSFETVFFSVSFDAFLNFEIIVVQFSSASSDNVNWKLLNSENHCVVLNAASVICRSLYFYYIISILVHITSTDCVLQLSKNTGIRSVVRCHFIIFILVLFQFWDRFSSVLNICLIMRNNSGCSSTDVWCIHVIGCSWGHRGHLCWKILLTWSEVPTLADNLYDFFTWKLTLKHTMYIWVNLTQYWTICWGCQPPFPVRRYGKMTVH